MFQRRVRGLGPLVNTNALITDPAATKSQFQSNRLYILSLAKNPL